MNKKSLLVTLCLVFIGLVAGGIYVQITNNASTPKARTDYTPNNYDELSKNTPPPAAPRPADVPPATTPSSEVTKEGTVICLKPKSQNGPQNMSCAIGMQVDEKTSYALVSNDPSEVGSLPGGQKIRVFGLLTAQDSNYDISGTIKIKTLEKL